MTIMDNAINTVIPSVTQNMGSSAIMISMVMFLSYKSSP